MADASRLDAQDGPGVTLVRPFLGLRRADTVGACAELGLEPWHDPMNDDPAFRRVAIRQQILPALAEIVGGNAAPSLARTARRVAADQSLLAELAEVTPTSDCATLATDPAPVRQRRIIAWLRGHGVSPPARSLLTRSVSALTGTAKAPSTLAGECASRAAVARWCLSPPSGRHRTREAPNVRVAGVHCRHERVVAGSAGAR